MDLNTRLTKILGSQKYIKYDSYFVYQAIDGSEAVLTVLNGHIDGNLNYYEPNKLLIIESCGPGDKIIFYDMTI